jgi:septal ring factor EnvC (AmiA/AmiB activator)
MNGGASLYLQGLLGLVPLAVAWVAYRQAVKANKVTAEQADRQARRQAALERSKVDSEAYNRAKEIYEAALQQLEKQLDRMQAQADRLTEQLAREQDTSHTLRAQVSTLQQQMRDMERTVAALRRQLLDAGVRPALPPPPPPLSEEDQG